MYENTEWLLVNAANDQEFAQLLTPICNHFTTDINSSRVQVQLEMLLELVSLGYQSNKLSKL